MRDVPYTRNMNSTLGIDDLLRDSRAKTQLINFSIADDNIKDEMWLGTREEKRNDEKNGDLDTIVVITLEGISKCAYRLSRLRSRFALLSHY
jgi:hypothetical protein